MLGLGYGAAAPASTHLLVPHTPHSRLTGGPDTVMVQVTVSEFPLASTTLLVKVYVPAVVGVPLTTPEVVLRLRPAGSWPDWMEKVKDDSGFR